MRIEITKAGVELHVAIARDDGIHARFRVPRKGPAPHDAVHWCVESVLGLQAGFWGMIAAGADPEAIGRGAREGGHPSAARASVPAPAIIELLQAERLVECFEAESWSGSADDSGLRHMAEAGWNASLVSPLALSGGGIAAVRSELDRCSRIWAAAPEGGSLVLEWHSPAENRPLENRPPEQEQERWAISTC